uniref:Uncharacterized protein n=1 Tax=Kalanchoe fedtschenkoi TaxID=63787 RepID=A0A7N0UA49_KALFE
MQRPSTNSRSSEEHRIIFLTGDHDDAASGDLPLYTPMLKKERSQSVKPEGWIHCIPVMLMLCFFVLWMFSRPVNLVTKNEANIEGVQQNETMTDTLDYPLVDFSTTDPVFTSQAPAPQNRKLFGANGT